MRLRPTFLLLAAIKLGHLLVVAAILLLLSLAFGLSVGVGGLLIAGWLVLEVLDEVFDLLPWSLADMLAERATRTHLATGLQDSFWFYVEQPPDDEYRDRVRGNPTLW